MELNRKTKECAVYPSRVLQFGEGNFLRAFVDWIIQDMNNKADFNTGVDVVQPLATGMIDMLNKQDGLYHVYLKGMKDGEAVKEYNFVNCINNGINPYSDFKAYQEAILNPELRFVISNTTEAGISWDGNDTLDMEPQNSFPGKMTALLYNRFKAFNGAKEKGLIIIACELIDRNGDMLKKYVLQHAENWKLGDEFIAWLNDACAFCNSLVDRIVPGFPREDIKEIQAELGYEDNLVVVGEYFHLWVIEAPQWVAAEFPADKAGLEVKFVDDMTTFREQKVAVLNGAHTGTYATSYLYGIETVKEAYEHEVLGKFMRGMIYDEVLETLNGTKEELTKFAEKILERFSNPYIRHEWMSISLNGMSKWETRDLPSLLKYLDTKGELPKKLTFSLAAMIAFNKGKNEGNTFKVSDDQWILDFYAKAWAACDGSEAGIAKLVEDTLALDKVWKRNLNEVAGLTAAVSAYLYAIQTKGMKEAIKAVL
ncbi:MAG: tagaturonate reductase [Mangrovibacterium sp.]